MIQALDPCQHRYLRCFLRRGLSVTPVAGELEHAWGWFLRGSCQPVGEERVDKRNLCLCPCLFVCKQRQGQRHQNTRNSKQMTQMKSSLASVKGTEFTTHLSANKHPPREPFVLHLRPHWPENEERGQTQGRLQSSNCQIRKQPSGWTRPFVCCRLNQTGWRPQAP
ncbi:hypothetical protein QQF64_007261 [Cirrhinus molitorella]|uniref:Uncharacterized protein n=1 Tax=Cirrhinus molitorella TaxID=172907 RepID=A0ABR3MA84_9TELE